MHKIIESEPESALAQTYRRYIRKMLLPIVHGVADLLYEHSSVIELPEKSWFEEKFPGEPVRMILLSLCDALLAWRGNLVAASVLTLHAIVPAICTPTRLASGFCTCGTTTSANTLSTGCGGKKSSANGMTTNLNPFLHPCHLSVGSPPQLIGQRPEVKRSSSKPWVRDCAHNVAHSNASVVIAVLELEYASVRLH